MSPSFEKAEEATNSKMIESHQPENRTNADGALVPAGNSTENVAAKRQRRPSVRLGEIGGYQSSDSNRKTVGTTNKNHNWGKQLRANNNNFSKARTVMNSKGSEFRETLGNQDKIGSWKIGDSKAKRSSIASSKRVRSNFDGDNKFSGEDNGDDKFRVSDSESPERAISPIHSSGNLENENHDQELGNFRRVGASESGGDERNWKNNGDGKRSGVRDWLNGLGLGKYVPVFEIHEVDDDVLQLLTLDDLKDMGINAVGSRRKMFASIQKLREGFS